MNETEKIFIPYSEKEIFKRNDVYFIFLNQEIKFSDILDNDVNDTFQKMKDAIIIKKSYLQKVGDENLDYYLDISALQKIDQVEFLTLKNKYKDEYKNKVKSKSVFNFE